MGSVFAEHRNDADLYRDVGVCVAGQGNTRCCGARFIEKSGAGQGGRLKVFDPDVAGVPTVQFDYIPATGTELAEQCSDLFHDPAGLGDAVTLMVDRSFGQTWVLTGYKDHLSTANSLTEWGW